MLIGLALMTHTSYNDVSVVINIVVEPLLCLLIMIPALLSILGIDKGATIAFSVFKYSTWALIILGVICLIYAGYWFFSKGGKSTRFQLFTGVPLQRKSMVRHYPSSREIVAHAYI